VELLTGQHVVGYDNAGGGARVGLADGRTDGAALVIAADGLHSAARDLLVGDTLVDSGYLAYRAAIPIGDIRPGGAAETDVVVYSQVVAESGSRPA
jgi:salicylate hydroxylase